MIKFFSSTESISFSMLFLEFDNCELSLNIPFELNIDELLGEDEDWVCVCCVEEDMGDVDEDELEVSDEIVDNEVGI